MTDAKPPRRIYRRTRAEQTALGAEVIRVSLRLFAEGGAEAISMRKLAAEVGVAPMSLYRYFPSKAHLLRHVWQEILATASIQGMEACGEVPGGHGRLCAFFSGFLQYWLDNPDHYTLVFAGQPQGAATGLAAGGAQPDLNEVLEAVEELLDECADGALSLDLRQLMAVELVSCAMGFLLATLGILITPVEQVSRLKDRMLDGLRCRVQAELAALDPQASGASRLAG